MTKIGIMHQFIGAVLESDEWYTSLNSPRIKKAEGLLNQLTDKLQPMIPTEFYLDLQDAVCELISANIEVSLLHGMNVGSTFQAVTSSPSLLYDNQ